MGETRDTTSLVNKIFNLNLLKFKHVYGSPEKNCYNNIKITKNANDSQFCAVNPKFLAVVTEVTGGGAFVVIDLKNTGRIEENYGRVIGHKGAVLDIKWCPFNDNIIASCSDDCTVKIWHIPDGDRRTPIVDSLMTLAEHKRRVPMIEWHPTADQILFSIGFDHLILIWHTGTGQVVGSINCHPDTIQSLSFNRDGSLIATTCKDKCIRVIDPRTGKVVSKGKGHLGSKSSKIVFLGDTTRLFTTGFSKYSDRQWAIWNQYDLREPLTIENIDSSSGVMFPFYDHDTKMVYIAGKGDGSIRYYELVNQEPFCHYVSQFITGFPQRGLGVMPKRGLDTSKCEIFRFYKLHAMKPLVEPIAMIVPRKSNIFQEDIYPPCTAPTPALTAEEWMQGKNRNPILISMKSNVHFNKTHKPMIQNHTDVNNDKKFIFIAQDNVVDYRENAENGYASPNQTQLLNQRNHSLSNSNSFSNHNVMHSSSHSSLSIGSSNSYPNNLNSNHHIANSYNNSYSSGRANSGSYQNSPYIEGNLNGNGQLNGNLNGKWPSKKTDYLDDPSEISPKQSPRKQSGKFFYNADNYETNSFEQNEPAELSELEEVRRQIANGRLIRGSTGLLIIEDAIPKNYDDLLGMYKNQLEEIHILKELNQKKDMKIKELEDLLEDFKMVDC